MSLRFQPYLDGYYDAEIQLQEHVYRRSEAEFARWERHKAGIASPDGARAWQQQVRAAALAGVGGLPPADTPLEPEVVGEARGDGFVVEKIIFQSLPRVYVTANLYRPSRLVAPTAAVIFVCGHAEMAKVWPEYQAVCQRLVRNGLVVLAIDPLGQGERKSYLDDQGRELVRWGTVEHTYAGYQCWWLGQSIARYFVHDVRRAIDYLASRPEVDPTRIGITGNSGGGTQTAWAMLLEPRLAAAAPATFLTRRRDYQLTGQYQDAEQHLLGGTSHGIDHEDCLIAFAPRPALVLAADSDYFNVEGTVAAVEHARPFYRLLGVPDHLGFVRTPGTHAYHPALARAATEFFVRRLLGGDPREVDHAEPVPLDPAELLCTRSGQVLVDRPETRRVFDLNRDEYRARSSPSDDPSRVAAARDWLASTVRNSRRPVEPYPRWLPQPAVGDPQVTHGLWWSEPDVLNAGVLVRPAGGRFASLLIALFDRGTAELDERESWLVDRARGGQAVLALDVRGTGALTPREVRAVAPDRSGDARSKLLTDLLWLDDSLAAMQIFDVLRSVELARRDAEIGLGERPIHLFGAGRGAYRAYLAGALETSIARVVLADRLLSFEQLIGERTYLPSPLWQGLLPEILVPGLAAHADLPEFARLYQDRELVIAPDG